MVWSFPGVFPCPHSFLSLHLWVREESWPKLSFLLHLGPLVLPICLCIIRQKTGISGKGQKEELLSLVFVVWVSSCSPPGIAEGHPFNLGDKCYNLVFLLVAKLVAGKCQSGLLSLGVET